MRVLLVTLCITAAVTTAEAQILSYGDHIRPDDRGTTHYWSARGGVVFR